MSLSSEDAIKVAKLLTIQSHNDSYFVEELIREANGMWPEWEFVRSTNGANYGDVGVAKRNPTVNYATQPCSSCEAPMIWATSPAGKLLPLDARPTSGMYNDGAVPPKPTYRIEVDNGGVKRAVDAGGAISHETYVSHFATCPNAGQHSRGGKR